VVGLSVYPVIQNGLAINWYTRANQNPRRYSLGIVGIAEVIAVDWTEGRENARRQIRKERNNGHAIG
jgi:hypothetical protein